VLRATADEATELPAAAECNGRIGAVRIGRRDVGVAQRRYARRVDRPNTPHRVERMPVGAASCSRYWRSPS